VCNFVIGIFSTIDGEGVLGGYRSHIVGKEVTLVILMGCTLYSMFVDSLKFQIRWFRKKSILLAP
jgi:hypothetical protein